MAWLVILRKSIRINKCHIHNVIDIIQLVYGFNAAEKKLWILNIQIRIQIEWRQRRWRHWLINSLVFIFCKSVVDNQQQPDKNWLPPRVWNCFSALILMTHNFINRILLHRFLTLFILQFVSPSILF